jgi:hypothetical protein
MNFVITTLEIIKRKMTKMPMGWMILMIIGIIPLIFLLTAKKKPQKVYYKLKEGSE